MYGRMCDITVGRCIHVWTDMRHNCCSESTLSKMKERRGEGKDACVCREGGGGAGG